MNRLNKLFSIILISIFIVSCGNELSSTYCNGETSINTSLNGDQNTATFLNKSYKVETEGDVWNEAMGEKNLQFFDASSTSYPSNAAKLLNYLNCGDPSLSLISSIEGNSLNNTGYKENTSAYALMLGNGSSSMGSMLLNFSIPVSKIEIEVQSYYKPYPDYTNPGNYVKNADMYSVLAVGTSVNPKIEVIDMSINSYSADDLPITSTRSIEFSKGINQVIFTGIGNEEFSAGSFAPGRIAFHYIAFYY